MTLAQARFLDAQKLVFRLLPGSEAIGKASNLNDLGYYAYHVPVYVSPTYCEKCQNGGRTWGFDAFSDIQSGIGSGAQRVLVEPGLYRQNVYLVNGVEVFGSGAALTVIFLLFVLVFSGVQAFVLERRVHYG